LLDYLHEVEHMAERVKRLEQAIAEAVQVASPQMQEVVRGLQALRGIAQISAVTLVAELDAIRLRHVEDIGIAERKNCG